MGQAPQKGKEHIGASPGVREAICVAIGVGLDRAQYEQGLVIHQIGRLAQLRGGSPPGDEQRLDD